MAKEIIKNGEIVEKLGKKDFETPIFVCDRFTGKEFKIQSISHLTNGNGNKILIDINTNENY